MPTVTCARETQGFRPWTNPKPLAGLRGLGQGTPMLPAGLLSVTYADGTTGFFDPADGTYYDSQGNDITGYVQSFGGAKIGGPASAAAIAAAEGLPAPTGGAGVPATPSPTVIAPAPAGPSTPAGAPTGSYLLYTGNWSVTLTQSMNSIIAAVRAAIAGYGLQVGNVNCPACSSVTPSSVLASAGIQSFQVQLQILVTGTGFAQPSDAGSIVDHAFYTVTGKMPTSSSTTVQQLPGVAGAAGVPPAAPSQSITSWLEQNALWIGLGIGAIVLVPRLMR